MSLSWIFSNLLVFSQTNFCCTIHYRGRVCSIASCCSQILWIVYTMRDYGMTYKSVHLMCDSSSAICLVEKPVFLGRAKHIKVRHHFLRDYVEMGDTEMKYIETSRQLADIFTKSLDVTCFASLLRGGLGVCHPYGMV
jgi:hypothetical protein